VLSVGIEAVRHQDARDVCERQFDVQNALFCISFYSNKGFSEELHSMNNEMINLQIT